jgi:hypothetical protein
MAGEAALGRAVLELSTDGKQLDTGLADVPKKVAKVGESVKGLAAPLGQVNGLLETFGVGLSIGAVVAFGKSVLDLADNIVKVHDKTGLATDDVQRLQYIAEQSGNSIDDLSGAISKLQVRLADGKAKAGIEALGLNFKKIREESPYDALADVAEAIGKIENPTLRAQRAVEVFGKAGTEILPTLVSNFKELGNAAPVMSEETVQALDAAGDAIARFGSTLKVWAAESYNYARGFFDKLVAEVYRMVQRLYENAAGLAALAAKLPGASKIGIDQKFVDGLKESAVWYGNVAKAMDTTTVAATKNKPAVAALPPIHEKLSAEAKKAAEALQSLTDKLSGADTAQQVALLDRALRSLEKSGTLTGQQMKAVGEAAQKLRDDGAQLTPRLAELARIQDLVAIATKNAAAAAKEQDEAFKRFNTSAGVYIANLPTAIFQTRSFAGSVAMVSKEAATYQGNMAGVRKVTVDWAGELANVARILAQGFTGGGVMGAAISTIESISRAMDVAAASTKKWGNSAGVAAPLFSSSATGAQKAAAGVASGAAIASGAMEVWAATSEKAGKAAGTLNGAVAGAKAGAAFGPYGVAIGAAAGAVVGLVRALNDGRQAVQEFAKTFDTAAAGSGFDELHAKLLKVAGGEQLWIDLTQKVGRGDVAAAKKAIDAINAALGDQDAWLGRLPGVLEKYGIAWEQAGQAVNQARLDEVAKQLIQDFADLSRAGVDVDVITTKMSDSVNAYIQDAIRTGTEIPPAMKPLLQKMIDLGVLTDANGDKITDLEGSGITFAQTMTEGFQSVVSAIKELTKALGGVPAALDKIPGKKTIDVEYRGRRTGYAPGDNESTDGGSEDPTDGAVPMAGGGFGRVTRPTLFYSRGDEDFAFSGEGKTFGLSALASRPIDVTVVSQLDGRTVARNQIRHTPNALATAGVRSR